MKPICSICKRNFRTLTKEGLCAGCYLKKNKRWASEYSNEIKDPKTGHLVSNESPMKFRRGKKKK